MIGGDASAGRPPGPAALWVSFRRGRQAVTVLAILDGTGTITDVPPIARWSLGQRFTVLHRWARRHDVAGARFAWIGADGVVSEVWA